jgi:hypothetical protein
MNPIPSKAEEIAILRETAERLGPHSYCANWLREMIPFVESDIRGDMAPNTTMAETLALRHSIISDAKEAREQADKVLAQARLEFAKSQELAANLREAVTAARDNAIHTIQAFNR